MSDWRHPVIGPIAPMPRDRQPWKTWKHLYDPAEHWDRLCEGDFQESAIRVGRIAGRNPTRVRNLNRVDAKYRRLIRPLLEKDHDAHYSPAYLKEMRSEGTIWAEGKDRRRCFKALSPRSVFLVVERREMNTVVTAFRPHPPTSGVNWSEDDFGKHARRYFSANTGAVVKTDKAREVAQDLEKYAQAPPGDAQALWWLALSVGMGRVLSSVDEVAAALPAAEKALGAAATETVNELEAALDWSGTLDGISDGLEDDRSDSLEEALASGEDLLVAAAVLGFDEEAASFLQDAAWCISWVPAAWGHLIDLATRRQAVVGTETLAGQFWTAVAQGVTGALLRESEPVSRPDARFADLILPAPSAWEKAHARASALAIDTATHLVDMSQQALQWIDGLVVQQPVPAMGADKEGASTNWELRATSPIAGHQRVFVVDDEEPEGAEITDFAKDDDDKVTLWELEEPGQVALVLIFASDAEIPGDRLDELLTAAEQRGDIAVEIRVISRPR